MSTPAPPRPPIRLVGDAWALYRSSFARWAPVALTAALLHRGIEAFFLGGTSPAEVSAATVAAAVEALGRPTTWIGVLLVMGIATVTALAVLDLQHGTDSSRATLAASCWRAIRKLPGIVAAMAALSAGLLVYAGVAAILLVTVGFASTAGTATVPSLDWREVIVFVLAAVPIVYFLNAIALWPAASMIGDLGAFAALRASWRLVRGRAWWTATVLSIATLLVSAIYGACLGVGALAADGWRFATPWLAAVANALTLPYLTAVLVTLYRELSLPRR